MDKKSLEKVSEVYPLQVKPYQLYMTDAENPTVVEKVNAMIQNLHHMGRLTNNVVLQWNEVMKWVVDGGIEEITTDILLEKLDVALNGDLRVLSETLVDEKIGELVASGQFEEKIGTAIGIMHENIQGSLDGFNVKLADKVGGQRKLKPEEFSAESLSLVTGNGVINLLTVPQNKSVTPVKTTFLKEDINLFDKNNETIRKGFMLDHVGIEKELSSHFITHEISVSEGETYSIPYAESIYGAFFDENGNFVSKIGTSSGTATPFNFTVPANAKIMKLNGRLANIDGLMVVRSVNYPSVYTPYLIHLQNAIALSTTQKNQVEVISDSRPLTKQNLLSIVNFESSDNVLDVSKVTDGQFLQGNTPQFAEGYFTTDFIPVNKGDTIRLAYDDQMGGNNRPSVYGENNSFLGAVASVISADGKYREITLAIEGAKSFRTSFTNRKKLDGMITVNKPYPSSFQKYFNHRVLKSDIKLSTLPAEELLVFEKNPLKGKFLSINGDSIAKGNDGVSTTLSYGKIIADENEMTYQNIAVGGGTITAEMTNDSGAFRHSVSRTISNMDINADYVIWEGGVNDCALRATLGEISEGYDAVLDDTTFCGAVESSIKQLYDRFPGKKIGFVVVHRMADSQELYFPSLIQILEKWGMPYVNLYKEVPPLEFIPSLAETYTVNGDGWHPNAEGYRKYYVDKIETFMKSL